MIHFHNGDIVMALAKRSGIDGEHISFRESLVTGRVVPDDAWIETRARTLAEAHEIDLLRVRTELLEQEQVLDAAAGKGEEIVLWFEHDLFCLVHLVYLLNRLRGARLSLVWCPEPLAHNEPRELHLLFDSRAAVTPMMSKLAADVWRAYTSADPLALNAFLERDMPDFPFLRDGLTLHASRFPSTANGLGEIERRALTLLTTGAIDFATLFPQIDPAPPRFGFGDGEVLRQLRAIAWCAVPLVTIVESADAQPPKALLTITPAGENVVRGAVDALAVNDPDVWFGGTHLTKENLWRWDANARRIVASPSAAS
ncbi:MAG: hypothetical protein JO197_03430 [Acidobacteria bacterium]|nr:hypothetical protein [Acidobacteriota bacterium]MBV9476565.1 hypothetical protein [Acidobacteriota bacterium]